MRGSVKDEKIRMSSKDTSKDTEKISIMMTCEMIAVGVYRHASPDEHAETLCVTLWVTVLTAVWQVCQMVRMLVALLLTRQVLRGSHTKLMWIMIIRSYDHMEICRDICAGGRKVLSLWDKSWRFESWR